MYYSAGITDSALTVHGNLQAERLGRYFAQAGVRFTNIFSSDLQRAIKTAEAIRITQSTMKDREEVALPEVSPLAVLREQDFGFYEGKPFYTRQRSPKVSGKADYRSRHREDLDFKDVESTDSMTLRMDRFVQDHLLKLLYEVELRAENVVAIVSHGIILSHLWKRFLKLFPQRCVTLSPNISVGIEGKTVVLEHLGSWSNTGYLEVEMLPGLVDEAAANSSTDTVQQVPQSMSKSLSLRPLPLRLIVRTVNGKEHLKNLKRTRGGVGSSKHDEGQRKIESFFKKQKLGD